ncbi:hypothetical protein Tco_1034210 [Tanacetum coccineum]
MPTIKECKVVEEFRAKNDAKMVSKVFGYPGDYDHDKKICIDCAYNLKFSCMIDFVVLEGMDDYRYEGMGDVIFGKPFLREVRINAKRFEGMITIHNGNEEFTYQMARSNLSEQTFEKFQNSSKSLNNLLESQVSDKFKTGQGYNATTPAVERFVNSFENQEYNKFKTDKGYHVVPSPYTGNFIPSKPDVMFMDEIVESKNMDVITIVTPSDGNKVDSTLESADKGDAVEPKTVRKNSFSPLIIED